MRELPSPTHPPPPGEPTIEDMMSSGAADDAPELATELDAPPDFARIGRLTIGLVHELASPLLVARANVEVARHELTESPRDAPHARDRLRIVEEALDESGRAIERMSDLLSHVRGLAVDVRPELERLELGVEVQRAIDGLPREMLEGVALERLVTPGVAVTAHRLLVAQIVTNLVANAARAARALPSSRVRVHVYRAGPWGVVSVRDNGPGIPPDDQERMFEPFFTTHRDEGGLGLGLALCREYAVQMNARVSVESLPGRGACFRLRVRLA